MQIIAHRGASGQAPENTLAAFELAWQQAADGIELDLHLSRDGRVMVHHDTSTLRTAGVDLSIATTDSAVLRQLDVGRWRNQRFSGEKIPFLEEVLETVPATGKVLLEIKCGSGIVPALQTILSRCDAIQPHLALISFQLDTLLACRVLLPEQPCYLLKACDAPDGQGVHPPHATDLIELARTHNFIGLDPNHRGINAEFAAAAHAAGLRLLTWTVNDPTEARRMQSLKLAAITTDYPAEMHRALATPTAEDVY